jgi:hypothetical protein
MHRQEGEQMTAFTRKPLRVDAHHWEGGTEETLPSYIARWEVAVQEDTIHSYCGKSWREHAVTTDSGHRVVCPGQWAVREPNGDIRVLEDADFRAGYDPLPEQVA